jgi:putative transposase
MPDHQGVVKLHVGLDHDGYLPSFMPISNGKEHEVMARTLNLPKSNIIVFDRGYMDYTHGMIT